jgi:excinuclease ABC subunit A
MGRVTGILRRLRDAGNTLLVVEHDREVMEAADRILDMGPGPGVAGGRITCFGTPGDVARAAGSLTGAYLRGELRVDKDLSGRGQPPDEDSFWLEVRGATAHNLKSVDVAIPLQRLVCITGVSGSGKSTLIEDVLYPALLKLKGEPTGAPGAHREILGHEHVNEIVLVDQSPLAGRRDQPGELRGRPQPVREICGATRRRSCPGTKLQFRRRVALRRQGEHVKCSSTTAFRFPDCDGRFRGKFPITL